MCVSTLPRPGSTIILQTTAADFLSKISDGGDPQDFQFVDSGVAHAGGHRSRRMWFWPWISFPSRRSFIQSWRQSHMTVHKRIRRFNTRDTYPEQKLDNDLCQTVVAEGTMVFVRGQVGQDLDSSESVAIGDAVGQAEKAMANIEVLLKEAGSQLEHVCKITIYIVDPRYREGVYRVVGKWLKGVFPVSTGIVVSALARPEWLVEIDAIAVIPDQGL
jgi:enamine deaminase RidA (YjgF/YER057c/UK114 family)